MKLKAMSVYLEIKRRKAQLIYCNLMSVHLWVASKQRKTKHSRRNGLYLRPNCMKVSIVSLQPKSTNLSHKSRRTDPVTSQSHAQYVLWYRSCSTTLPLRQRLNNAHNGWSDMPTVAGWAALGATISPRLPNVPAAPPDSSKLNQTVNPENRRGEGPLFSVGWPAATCVTLV